MKYIFLIASIVVVIMWIGNIIDFFIILDKWALALWIIQIIISLPTMIFSILNFIDLD